MEPTRPYSESLKELQSNNGDRRFDRRYGIRLELKWKLIRRRRILDQGTGHTIDVSSGGILLDCGRTIPAGLNIELSIAWPVLLHNAAPLQLAVSGRIVRCDGHRAAIRMLQHEFRTTGIPAEQRGMFPVSARGAVPFFPLVGSPVKP
jgi:hypothetical protein